MHAIADQRRTFYYFLLAAVVIHSSLLVVKFRDQIATVFQPEEVIKIRLTPDTIKEMVRQDKKQIVQSEDSDSKDKPVDPAFLSDKDRNFDRQTVARNIDSFKKAAKGNAQHTQVAKHKESTQKKKANMKDMKLSDLGFSAGDPMPKEVSRAPASVSTKGMANGDPLSDGLSATNDYVEEVALGDFTHLNTVEFKYYGFYHRIRQKLEQFWGRSIQEKAHALFKQGRRVPASQDLVTSLRISMNTKGEIIDVKILGASGVKELDDAAIESFNQAGPFPNPPKDLLINGKAVIEWGFVVKT